MQSEKDKYSQFVPNGSEANEYVDLPKIQAYLESKGIMVTGGFEVDVDHIKYHLDESSGVLYYNEIPDCIFEEETYYLLGSDKGHLEPNEEYKKWVYSNDKELVYVKEAKQFFPKDHFIHDIMDDWIIHNNY